MARGKVNVGGVGVSEQTVAPTLNLIEAGIDFITVLVTNKDTEVAKLAITQTNINVNNANDIELAFNETAEVTISDLAENTEYNITVQATATDKLISEITTLTESTVTPPKWYGSRGVWAGGFDAAIYQDVIAYVTIATLANAVDFGNLLGTVYESAGCSDGSRGIIAGGTHEESVRTNVIQYITIATTGNAIDFGDLLDLRVASTAASNGTRAIFGGGTISTSTHTNRIDYVTIQTPGNAADFGDMTVTTRERAGLSDGVYGVFGGGGTGSPGGDTNTMDYVTIATLGNATTFGSISANTTYRATPGAAANDTRGLFFGGRRTGFVNYNYIEYITVATPSNSTDFGDISGTRSYVDGSTDGNRVVIAGGGVNIIDYVAIMTPGNAADFGDMTLSTQGAAAFSGN